MAIIISGNGIDMGNNPVSNASQIEVQENQVSPFSGFKNYIINGNFDIWQRGTSQTSSGYGSADRWLNIHNGSTKTVSKATSYGGGFNVLRTTVSSVTGSANYVRAITRIENLVQFVNKKLTLSFLAKADSAKKIGISITNLYGTGGTTSAQEDYAFSVFDIGTWFKKITVTFDGPNSDKIFGTNNDHCLQIQIWFDAGSDFNFITNSLGHQSGTFDIAQVQLEEGSVATPFEQRPVGLELSLCQRYYEVVDVKEQPQAAVFYSNWRYLPVVSFTLKRVIPTASFLGSVVYPNAVTYSTDYFYNVTRTTVGLVDMMARGVLYTYSIGLDAEL